MNQQTTNVTTKNSATELDPTNLVKSQSNFNKALPISINQIRRMKSEARTGLLPRRTHQQSISGITSSWYRRQSDGFKQLQKTQASE